jgi:hypothetical protein
MTEPSRASTSFLALTGAATVAILVWMMAAGGAPTRARAALLLLGSAVVVWALSTRPGRAGGAERLLVVLAATAAFWAGMLELTLLVTLPLARGLLVLAALAAIHAAALCAALGAGSRSAAGRLGRSLLAALAVLLTTLALVETAVRAASPVRSYELVPDRPAGGPCLLRAADGRLVGVPGCSGRYVHRDFPGLAVELNALGLRDGLDETGPPDPGQPSVLVLGDSFAFGMGVALDETFQQVLQRTLAVSHGAVRVYGAAMPGAGTSHEHEVLSELAPLVRPDVVVLALFEGNDLQDNLAGLEHRETPGAAPTPGPIPPWRFLASTVGVPFWRTSSSTLQLRRVDGRPTLVLQQAMLAAPPPRIEVMRSALLAELGALAATCDELGADLVVLLVPGRVQVDPLAFEAFAARHPGQRFERRGFHDRLAADIERMGILVVDPLPRLEAGAAAGETAYHPEGHWNRRGHAVAAELLETAVGPLVGARAGAPAGAGGEDRRTRARGCRPRPAPPRRPWGRPRRCAPWRGRDRRSRRRR